MINTNWRFKPTVVLSMGLALCILASGCVSIPRRELQSYRKAFDEAHAQSEDVLIDYAAALHAKSNLVVTAQLRNDPALNTRPLASRLGLNRQDSSVATSQGDIAVRLNAWEVVAAYNEALTAVASGAKASEVEGAVTGFLGAIETFPLKEVAQVAGEVVPYAGVITELLGIVQKEVEARRFRQAVLGAEKPMREFGNLLRKDAMLFRNYRVTLLNQRFRDHEIFIFDRFDRFRIVAASHAWKSTIEVDGLIKQLNANRVLAAGVETYPEVPAAVASDAEDARQGSDLVELRTLADAIDREASAARATVAELSAYHELMRHYGLLLAELDRTHAELTDAARRGTGRLPTIGQLQQVITSVRLAHKIYTATK